MIVHGFVVPDEVLGCLIARMAWNPFGSVDLEMLARSRGVPGRRGGNQVAMRVADRLIQRERKAGHIVREGMVWRWVG